MTAGSLDFTLLGMMQTTVTIYQNVTRDSYGKQTLGSGVEYDAHIAQGAMKISEGEDEDVPVTGKVYLGTIVNFDPAADVLEFPDGSQPRVVDVVVRYDEYGEAHHEEISVSREKV